MPKKISDMAVEKVPSNSNRFSLFQSKLQIAHYAQGSIIDYCHALYKAVVYLSKSPDDFTQADVDSYLQYLLSRKPMLSKMFRAKFMSMLTSGLSQEEVVFPQVVRKQCFEKAWVVYSRPPAKGVDQVLEYIGRYAYVNNFFIIVIFYCL